MLQHIRPAIVMMALFTGLTGVAYPLAVTGVAALVAPDKAGGSLVLRDGKIVGSALVGQSFTQDRYFHGRPSATVMPDPADPSKTVDAPYNAANSGGSNLGPTSQKLVDRVKEDMANGPATADAVTTSASGLDPHVSPANAMSQVARVAKARNLDEARLRALVEAHVEKPWLGVLGETRVNVLSLNLALDESAR